MVFKYKYVSNCGGNIFKQNCYNFLVINIFINSGENICEFCWNYSRPPFLVIHQGLTFPNHDSVRFDNYQIGSNEPNREKIYLRTCAPSVDSDQTAHARSLIRVFAECSLNSQGSRFLGEHTDKDAQPDQSLRWAHFG